MDRRRAGIVVGLGLVAVLVGLGLWRRAGLIDERAAARAVRHRDLATLTRTRATLQQTVLRAGRIETTNATLRATAAELTTYANALADQIRGVERDRDDATLSAFYAGGQAGQLHTCLDGITRALNQVSVGDVHSVATLESVRSACRAVSG
ncbi:MAG: hypothetical protein ACXV8T_16900 [Acidimicrobiia bacterium]